MTINIKNLLHNKIILCIDEWQKSIDDVTKNVNGVYSSVPDNAQPPYIHISDSRVITSELSFARKYEYSLTIKVVADKYSNRLCYIIINDLIMFIQKYNVEYDDAKRKVADKRDDEQDENSMRYNSRDKSATNTNDNANDDESILARLRIICNDISVSRCPKDAWWVCEAEVCASLVRTYDDTMI